MPSIVVNLNFPQMDEIAKAKQYLKYIPAVYHDHPAFDYSVPDFELRERDRAFLKEIDLDAAQFERVIDCLEKVAFMYRDSNPTQVTQLFFQHCDESLQSIKRTVLEHIVVHFWKKNRIEQKWHVFMRRFWENPDFNEPDLSAAFRKRSEKEKIKTRPKLEIHQKKL